MHISNTRFTLIATFVIAASAMLSIGCGSSNNSPGGTGGAGGGAGGGGGAVTHNISYTFDTGVQGWTLNTFADTTSENLAGNYADAAVSATPPTIEFDGAVGQPSPGSLKITVTFTKYGQYVDPVFGMLTPLVDETGRTLRARLQIASVSTGDFTGGAQLHVSTGANYAGYGLAGFPPFTGTGTWVQAALNFATQVAPVNPAEVIQVGVQIFTGNLMPAGTALPAAQTVVFNVDTVQD